MKPILIAPNSHEGPGVVQVILEERGLPFEVVELRNEPFPDPTRYSKVIVFGGPDSANDDTEKMKRELAGIRETLAAGIPYLGICLGMQALVKSQGGRVEKNPIREAGVKDPEGNFFEVDLTEAGLEDPLLQGVPNPMPVFQLHGETALPSSDMTVLGRGKWCENQIVRVGPQAWGFQCHFELTPEMFDLWRTSDSWLLELDSEQLLQDWKVREAEYLAAGRHIVENFLAL